MRTHDYTCECTYVKGRSFDARPSRLRHNVALLTSRSDQPESTTAAKGGKIHREIKRNITRTRADIKRLDNKVDRVENGIGTTGPTSLSDRLIKVERNTAKICREVGTFC